MNCSVATFSFSLCPLQALSADACRARPKENVRTQGLARGQLLMAFRWMEASSSLWPPERKATPAGKRKEMFNSHSVPVNFKPVSPPPLGLPVTAGGTVRRRAVMVAIATSSGLYLVEQLCPPVTMLGLRRVPSRYTWWSDMALYTAVRTCKDSLVHLGGYSSLPLLFTVIAISHTHAHANRKTRLLSDVLAAFQVMISIRQNLRLYDGHDAMLARERRDHQNKTKMCKEVITPCYTGPWPAGRYWSSVQEHLHSLL